LLRVLKEIMVMHRKEDIQLPTPSFNQVETYIVVPAEVEANLRVVARTSPQPCAAMMSCLDQYLRSDDFQSLVDKAQADYIVKTVREARRKLLERGGRLNFQNSNGLPITDFGNVEQKTDLRPIKAVVYSSVTKNLLSVTEMLIRLLGKEKVAEMYESPDLGGISAELSRFRHGMIEYKTCPVCKRESDIRLCKGRKGERCKETLVEVEMFATQARFLIEPERILQALNVPMQRLDGHPLSWYNKSRTFWRVGDILRVDVRDSHPLLPKRENEDYWKAFGADRCIELAEAYQYMGQD
jgi:hypothetical protein